MKKRPFLLALAVLGAVFVFFLALLVTVVNWLGHSTPFPLGQKVGVIEITGVIASSRLTNERIIRFKEDASVKAVVLRIDSPGGGVGPSQEIYREVQKLAVVKPVVVSMGAVAASGGYYVAVPGQRILANPGTITGSIGVIMEFTNVQELLGKIGLSSETVKSGKHKDIGSPVRPMSEQDREILQTMIDDVHLQFVTAVAEGRNIDLDGVRPLADGRIFTGRQAMAAGLVDEMGNLQDAIDAAAKLAGIAGKPQVVYPPEEKLGLFDYFVEESISHLRRGLNEKSMGGMQFLWTE